MAIHSSIIKALLHQSVWGGGQEGPPKATGNSSCPIFRHSGEKGSEKEGDGSAQLTVAQMPACHQDTLLQEPGRERQASWTLCPGRKSMSIFIMWEVNLRRACTILDWPEQKKTPRSTCAIAGMQLAYTGLLNGSLGPGWVCGHRLHSPGHFAMVFQNLTGFTLQVDASPGFRILHQEHLTCE